MLCFFQLLSVSCLAQSTKRLLRFWRCPDSTSISRRLRYPGFRREVTCDAQHAQPTDFYGNPCGTLGNPYINNCAYDAAGELLKWIYSSLSPRNDGQLGGDFVQFDQTEFLDDPIFHGMDTSGWLDVPTSCRNQRPCRLHIAFHGCNQYQGYTYFQFGSGMVTFGTTFVRNAGYNKWADSNGLLVLYPQATAMPSNPQGCWDWWGYDDPNYALKSGRQMRAVHSMVQRIVSAHISPAAQ
jgi:hypothetical protein